LPQRVSLSVNVGSLGAFRKFLDVFITMPKPTGGCDGHCGRADGDLSDDTKARFLQRVGELQVLPQETLFDPRLLLAATAADRAAAGRSLAWEGEDDCEAGSQDQARALCRSVLPVSASADWLSACADDVCAGGEEMANHTAMLVAQTEELYAEERKAAAPVVECHTCTPEEACFGDVSWALEIGIPAGYYQANTFAPMIDASSCFEEVQGALRAWQQDPDFDTGGMQDRAMPTPCGGLPEPYQKHGLTFCR